MVKDFSGADSHALPDTYFPWRNGCQLTLSAGDLEFLDRSKYNDGLDHYRLMPAELAVEFERREVLCNVDPFVCEHL
jgi:hypothetical protein